ncbi:laminin-like protein epi-1 [Trichonephila inaurata madagascariensis]|uniref:Laminin-like protein epi-1 n=1 Tax=Trichonephila inaurata madagascariensis TaxID=2747483 RepID=A0A8X7BNW9_9ARAC|nr:laminin-like protein epi-1 [Trichonephila inaurata madagascariensis]
MKNTLPVPWLNLLGVPVFPGVLGFIRHRWGFLGKNEGCLECDVCVHGLLDATDALEELISPVTEEMKDVSSSYFANKRLQNVNATADTLRLGVDELLLDPTGLDYSPLVGAVQNLEKQRDIIDRTANHLLTQADTINTDADNTRIEALEVEKLIRDAINNVNEIIEELGKLSEGLQGSAGPDVDNLIRQAEYILEELKNRDFDPAQNDTVVEYTACEDLLDHVKSFEVPVLESKMKFEEENEKLMNLANLLNDLKNNSQRAYGVADDAQTLQEELQTIPVKEIIAQVEENADKVYEILKNASDLLDKTRGFIGDANKSFGDLSEDAERLLLAIRDLKDQIQDTEESFKDITDPIREATEHAAFLMEQAMLLDQSLANTRDSADAAVKAAKAYENIEQAINDAYEAAEAALKASDQAGSMSDGVLDKTSDSKENTGQLLESAYQLEDQVTELEPQLQSAKDGVLLIGYQNGKTTKGLEAIRKDLEKLPLQSLGVLAELAAKDSADADATAKRAAEKIEDIVSKLPDDETRATEVPKAIEDAKQAIKAAHSYADRVASIVPDTNALIDKASKKESAMRIIGTDVSEKIAKLQQKVAIARTQANRIKLGVQFFENTTLQVRNPESMHKAATYTYLSMYFKTTERYGLLTFVGNEKGSHSQMKRVLTDDYLALEVRGGYLVLVMDLGSGSQSIKHDTYVSDGKWHQVIVERTGKTCSLTVRSEDQNDAVVEGFLPGTYSVFNLDQKVSKFFIGGISEKLSLPDTLENYHFDGCIEDVEFGETPIGLWDFVFAENNIEGCEERNELSIPPSNGLRFSGSGYVILPRKRHQFSSETTIKMLFKTYAKDGLMFLIGKNNDFFALEMQDGHVILKYDLGSGLATLKSPETYNDGKWHSLEAARVDKDAILKVDQEEVDSGISPGGETSLSTTNQIFVGGYPRRQPFSYPITNIGFEGCIMDMQISAEITDLNKNKEALGVVNGCPVTIARTVSFNNVSAGYIGMPPANLQKLAQLTFKFKTSKENGVIFYSANEDNSNYLFIGLHDGNIIMKSRPGEIEVPVDALVSTSTPMYFGGVPDGFAIAEDIVPYYSPFVGCIGDTTVNNIFQNFADTQDKMFVSLASCPLEEPFEESTQAPLPVGQSPRPDSEETEGTTVPTTEEEESVDYPEGPEPTPVGQCALPLPPRRDITVKPGDGIRFGNTPYSRQQFTKPGSFMSSILEDSTFALEFKSSSDSGVMFYVSDVKHIDFVGLFMKEGKIVYVFNCGTGTAVITSQNTYNDGTWHRVVFSRQGQEGRLVIDDDEEVRGTSIGSANSVNVKPPFYIGGVTEEVAREAKNNLKGINYSFPGCIRNVEAQGDLLTSEKPSLTRNTTGCSSKVEEGTFFSSDGGYLILYDKYRVGQRISITVDIKPRNLSGVLMAVHGRQDYLILQLIDGRVEFGVDNGAGPITASFIPTDKHYLCDGEFHTIQVVKSNNFVTLSVDGVFSEPGIGVGGVSSTDTNDPLYIGGLPEASLSKRGVLTFDQFAGCMRYLELDSKPQSLAQSRVFGQVTLNTCPTI